MKQIRALATVVLTLVVATTGVFGQETDEDGGSSGPALGFTMGITFGVSSFEDTDTGEIDTYQLLALRPDISVGPVGVGFDLPLNYRFTGGADRDEFEVREEDWVPDDDSSFLELYLPKFRYIRYGTKGDDIYARLGGIGGASIGNGFIVGNYSNELYLPERRVFGAVFDLDRAFFGERYVGVETLVSNLAAWDVMAGRLFVRPLAGTGLPLLPNLQVGVTAAIDRDPYYFAERDPDSSFYQAAPGAEVTMWGVDLRQPILAGEAVSLAAFSDVAFQEDRLGGMVGLGGRAFGFLLYGAQIRLLEDNFVPGYFDNIYDRRRLARLAVYEEDVEVEGGLGWLAQAGFSLFGDAVVFNNTVSGSFDPGPGSYPEIRSSLTIAEGIVPGFSGLSAEAGYTKFDLREVDDFLSAEEALIGAQLNIRSGPVVISLVYDLTYDPESDGDPWTVTSGLESTISF